MDIARTGRTGCPGDGVVAVLPIQHLYPIRTNAKATPEAFWRRAHAQARAR